MLIAHSGKHDHLGGFTVAAARRLGAAQLWGTKAEYLCHVDPPKTWLPSDSQAPSMTSTVRETNLSVQFGKVTRYQNIKRLAHFATDCDERVIKEMAAAPILDLDDPKIGIKAHFAREERIRLCVLYARWCKARRPSAIAVGSIQPGGRGTKERACAVEAIHLDEDRTGVIVAVTHDNGRRAFDGASTNKSLDPEFSA